MCKICAEIHKKNTNFGRNFTYLEDPDMTATQTMHFYFWEFPQNYHLFALFDPTQIGI